MNKMSEFILVCLHEVTNAHLLHLKSRSYAQHMALATFYEELADLADTVAESFQGKYERIMEYPNLYIPPEDDPEEELESFSEYVEETRVLLPQDSEIQNAIDEIQELVNSTIYKLKFLR